MFVNRRARLVIIAALAALLLFACDIEEDLRLELDGSGTYRVRLTIPKNLSDGFDDLRKQAETDGFTVADQGTTETERFIVLRKTFDDITSLNDDHSQFELTITRPGFLRREYRFRANLQSVGFGAYQRQFTVTMPVNVTSASAGKIEGSRVRWNARHGGTIEITASGFGIPLSRNQRGLVTMIVILGVVLFIFVRRRRTRAHEAACAHCRAQLAPGTRFCRTCGTGAPVAQM